jgi:hypothetical protein
VSIETDLQAAAAAEAPPADKPPRKRGRSKGSRNRRERAPRRPAGEPLRGAAAAAALKPIRTALDSYCALIGTALSMHPKTAFDGHVILQRGPYLTDALIELAKRDPNVKRALSALVTGSAWGGVILASGNILLPIAAFHGMIPLPIPAELFPDLCGGGEPASWPTEATAGDNGDAASDRPPGDGS